MRPTVSKTLQRSGCAENISVSIEETLQYIQVYNLAGDTTSHHKCVPMYNIKRLSWVMLVVLDWLTSLNNRRQKFNRDLLDHSSLMRSFDPIYNKTR